MSPTKKTPGKKTKATKRSSKKTKATGISKRSAEARGLTQGQAQLLQETRCLTTEALRKLPEGVLRRAVRRLDYQDTARARVAFRRLQARDDQGVIPPNALPDALRQLDGVRSRTASLAQAQVAGVPTGQQVVPESLMSPFILPTAGLSPAHTGWTSLGPGNIGGRTRAIVVHPGIASTMWAGSSGGGVWRTDDGGATWSPVDDLMANLAVCCMVMDPTDPNIIYAGTGEGFANADAIRGAGIFRTTDGVHWTQLPSTTGQNYQAINRLAISRNGKILLVGTPRGIFRSDDASRATWTQPLLDAIADVDFHPTDNTKAVAGGLNNGQAYFSTDGGQTWKQATHASPWSGRVEVTYARQNPNIVYASVVMSGGGEIWRSTDGGRTYVRRNTQLANGSAVNYLAGQGWYANVIWAGDPTNSELVIVGGLDLFKSTNGGNTLIDISTWWDSRSAHADHHCITSHAGYNGTTNKTVFFGNDGGIFTARDLSTVGNNAALPRINGWQELNNTYGVTQFFAGAGHPATGTIIGGAQDNGTLRFTSAGGSQGWTSMFGGDGGDCAADPSNPNFLYGEYVNLNIHRSTNGGASADYISGQFWNGSQWTWKPIPFRIPDAMSRQALFIAPFVLDPNNANRILAGGVSLWRTNDAKTPNTNSTGPIWTSIKNSVGPQISAIAVAQGKPDLIWVGHTDGQVFKTDNGTQASPLWQKMDHTGPNPLTISRYCMEITIDPRDLKIVYVTFGGYTKNNVWKTVDGGLKWGNIGSSLPEAPVRSLTIHPRKSKLIYLGTEVGMFASENAGTSWSPTNEGPTNCSVDDLFWMGEKLICVTHGRGMFSIDLSAV